MEESSGTHMEAAVSSTTEDLPDAQNAKDLSNNMETTIVVEKMEVDERPEAQSENNKESPKVSAGSPIKSSTKEVAIIEKQETSVQNLPIKDASIKTNMQESPIKATSTQPANSSSSPNSASAKLSIDTEIITETPDSSSQTNEIITETTPEDRPIEEPTAKELQSSISESDNSLPKKDEATIPIISTCKTPHKEKSQPNTPPKDVAPSNIKTPIKPIIIKTKTPIKIKIIDEPLNVTSAGKSIEIDTTSIENVGNSKCVEKDQSGDSISEVLTTTIENACAEKDKEELVTVHIPIDDASNDSQLESNSTYSDLSEKEHHRTIHRELKSLMKSAQESKIISECTQITSKTRKSRTANDSANTTLNTSVEGDRVKLRRASTASQKSTTSENMDITPKRSMRSQNPEFVHKVKQFLNTVTGKKDSEGDGSDNETDGKSRDTTPSGSKKKKAKDDLKILDKDGKLRFDPYCWRCHWTIDDESSEKHKPVFCTVCPRSYHFKCVSGPAKTKCESEKNWVCPECLTILQAESSETRSSSLKKISLGMLCDLLKYAIERIMEMNGMEPFLHPVDRQTFAEYEKYVVHPMDLSQMKANIDKGQYGSTEAFLSDAQWILHNSIIFNTHGVTAQSRLSGAARTLVRACRSELTEIEACPECYAGANAKRPTWFVDVCTTPHIILWAKLKGFPYWPAKAMSVSSMGQVDVRFFGAHDRAWVPAKDCFLYSEKDPNNFKNKRQDILDSMQEAEHHISNISKKYGKFVYPPFRTPFDPSKMDEQLKMMIPTFDGELKLPHIKEKKRRNSKSCNEASDNEELSVSIREEKRARSKSRDKSRERDKLKEIEVPAIGVTTRKRRRSVLAEAATITIMDSSSKEKRLCTDEEDSTDATQNDLIIIPSENDESPSKTSSAEECSILETSNGHESNSHEVSGSKHSQTRIHNSMESKPDPNADKTPSKTIEPTSKNKGKLNSNAIVPTKNVVQVQSPEKSVINVETMEVDPTSKEKNMKVIKKIKVFRGNTQKETLVKFVKVIHKMKANSNLAVPKASISVPPKADCPDAKSNDNISNNILDTTKEGPKDKSPASREISVDKPQNETPKTKKASSRDSSVEKAPQKGTLKDKSSSFTASRVEKPPQKAVPKDKSSSSTASSVEKPTLKETNTTKKPSSRASSVEKPTQKEISKTKKPSPSSSSIEKHNEQPKSRKSRASGVDKSLTQKETPKAKTSVSGVEEPPRKQMKLRDKSTSSEKETNSNQTEKPIEKRQRDRSSKGKKSRNNSVSKDISKDNTKGDRNNTENKTSGEKDKMKSNNSNKDKSEINRSKSDPKTINETHESKTSKANKDSLHMDDDTSLAVIARESAKNNVINIPGLPTISNIRSLSQAPNISGKNSTKSSHVIEVDVDSSVFTPTSSDNIKNAANNLQKLKEKAPTQLGRVEVKAFARIAPPTANSNVINNVEIEIKSEPIDVDDPERQIEKLNMMNAFQLRPVNPIPTTSNLREIRLNRTTTSPATTVRVNRSSPKTTEVVRTRAKKSFPQSSKPDEGRSELNSKNSMVYIPIQPPMTQAPVRMVRPVVSLNGPNTTKSTVTTMSNLMNSGPLLVQSLPNSNALTTSNNSMSNALATIGSVPGGPSSSLSPMQGPTIGQIHTSVHTVPLYTPVNGQWTFSLQPMMSVGVDDPTAIVNGGPEVPNGPTPPVCVTTPSNAIEASRKTSDPPLSTQPKELPRLQQRPSISPLDDNSASPSSNLPTPSTAGPITAKLNRNAVKLTDFFRNLLEDTIEKVDEPLAQVTALKQKIEQMQWRHKQDVIELKHNQELTLTEMRQTFEKEKDRLITNLRTTARAEFDAAIQLTKSKQWCANCMQEAQFYCCWNTSYCDHACQRAHWTRHYAYCTQNNNKDSASESDSNKRLDKADQPPPVLQNSSVQQANQKIKRVVGQNNAQNSILVSVMDDKSAGKTVKCLGTYKSPSTGQITPLILNKQIMSSEESAKKVVTSGGYLIIGANNPPAVPTTRSFYSVDECVSEEELRLNTRQINGWQRNKSDKQNQPVEGFVSSRGKRVPKKIISIKKGCLSSCHYNCSKRITKDQRVDIFSSYHNMTTIEKHRYILRTTERILKRCSVTETDKKKYRFVFHFEVLNARITVCKQFYVDTLSISQRTIYGIHQRKNLDTGEPQSIRWKALS